MAFSDSVYRKVALIPKGKVATYKGIAESLGDARLSRAVGNALNHNPDTEKVPCYRVVRSDGLVGGYSMGQRKKIELLMADGIEIREGRIINLGRFLYQPPKSSSSSGALR